MTVWKSVTLSIFKISHPPTQLFAKNGYLDGVEYKNQIDIASFGGSSINSTIGGETNERSVYPACNFMFSAISRVLEIAKKYHILKHISAYIVILSRKFELIFH